MALYLNINQHIAKFNSTETVLLRVQNDILVSLEFSHTTTLHLDLSAAFDTIDYNVIILLHRIEHWFVISSSTLSSLSSFLANRFQTEVASNSKSKLVVLESGIS